MRKVIVVNKMREVIWDELQRYKDSKDDCRAALHDALVDVLEIQSPSDEQIKRLYDNIPMIIVYNGAACGFGDTCVREDLREFIRHNLEQVKDLMK